MNQPVKFGDRYSVCVSPKLVLQVGELLQEWLIDLGQREEIDAERESISMAQKLLNEVFQSGNQEIETNT